MKHFVDVNARIFGRVVGGMLKGVKSPSKIGRSAHNLPILGMHD